MDAMEKDGAVFPDGAEGDTNKLTAAGFERARKKASIFNAAQFSLVGNNATGANMFGRNKF